MATTKTTNYSLTKIDKAEKLSAWPDVQAANMDAIDSRIKAAADSASTANSDLAAYKRTNDSAVAGKQATLTSAQLSAVNSGVTAAKVGKYDGYEAQIKDVGDRVAASEVAIGAGVQQMEPSQIQRIVQTGESARYFPVGAQITVPWTYDGTTYDWVWDVVHHYDGSDDAHPLRLMADGTSKPAMCLMAHYAIPLDTPYSPQEAAIVAQSDMAAGTYHLAVNVHDVWSGNASSVAAAAGTKSYQFTTTKSHPKGAQFMWNASYNEAFTQLTVYDEPMGGTASEKVTVTSGTGGTDLGTMSEESSSTGLNNIQRACEGNNRWLDSALRRFLNSTDAKYVDTLVTPFHRRASYDGKAGVLSGFGEDFRNVLASVTNYTKPHVFDGDVIDETHDTLYLPSAREHAFANYLSNTTGGYNREGVPLDYWTQLAKANGLSNGLFDGWQTHPALITHSLANHSEARDVWGRSAYRFRIYASSAECVYASGVVGNGAACYGTRCAPAACIA